MACLGWQSVPGYFLLDNNNIPPHNLLRENRLNVDKIKDIQSTHHSQASCLAECKLGTKHFSHTKSTKQFYLVALEDFPKFHFEVSILFFLLFLL